MGVARNPYGGETPTMLGISGFSNTWRRFRGIDNGGIQLEFPIWPYDELNLDDFGGAMFYIWGDPNSVTDGFPVPGAKYNLIWGRFTAAVAAYGASHIYCEIGVDNTPSDVNISDTERGYVTHWFERLRTEAPDAKLLVAPVNTYEGVTCPDIGQYGWQKCWKLSQWTIEQGLADGPGPIIGPITADITTDNCHANLTGEIIQGRQLYEFFRSTKVVEEASGTTVSRVSGLNPGRRGKR